MLQGRNVVTIRPTISPSSRTVTARPARLSAVAAAPHRAGDFESVRLQSWQSPEPLLLKSGAILEAWSLAYETYGRLNAARDNAILVMHALSGDAHVAGRYSPDDHKPGWWDTMVGPGRALDTNRFFVICANVIGGCRGSTGPCSVDPRTGDTYRLRFPVVTIGDMVAAQVKLLDHLGISQLHAAIGGSMGGMQVIDLAVNHPDRVRIAIPLATTARSSAQAIAWSSIGRRAITIDPAWQGGNYQTQPGDGLGLARMIAHMTYVSDQRLTNRFDRATVHSTAPHFTLEQEYSVEGYLDYQAQTFVERFDANSYLYITKAMDYWDISAGHASMAAAFAAARCRWLVASFQSDWLYPPTDSDTFVDSIRRSGGQVEYHTFASTLGHDAFLLEHAALTPVIDAALRR
ncbi:MAG: homoserine O-acetyltransferase [Herpetosiphon sp.]